jgi:sialic acid synthase SpsE
LEKFGGLVDIIKIGSGDFDNLPFISELLALNKPTILSTGLASSSEVDYVLWHIAKNFPSADITVLQCTSLYPAFIHELNLKVLSTYKHHPAVISLGAKVGYSHHFTEAWPMFTAAALGAECLEFHFTAAEYQRSSFRDHLVSLTKLEVNDLAARLADQEHALGCGTKAAVPRELSSGHVSSFRRGCYYAKSMCAGDVVNLEDIKILRPRLKTSPIDVMPLIGEVLGQDVSENEEIQGAHFEN